MPDILVARNEHIKSLLLGCSEQFAVLESMPSQILGLCHLMASQETG
jgi:hypothetical protein